MHYFYAPRLICVATCNDVIVFTDKETNFYGGYGYILYLADFYNKSHHCYSLTTACVLVVSNSNLDPSSKQYGYDKKVINIFIYFYAATLYESDVTRFYWWLKFPCNNVIRSRDLTKYDSIHRQDITRESSTTQRNMNYFCPFVMS